MSDNAVTEATGVSAGLTGAAGAATEAVAGRFGGKAAGLIAGAGSAAGLGNDSDNGSGSIGVVAADGADTGFAETAGTLATLSGDVGWPGAGAVSWGIMPGIGARTAAPEGGAWYRTGAATEAGVGAGSCGFR